MLPRWFPLRSFAYNQERWQGVADGCGYKTPSHMRWLQPPRCAGGGAGTDAAGAELWPGVGHGSANREAAGTGAAGAKARSSVGHGSANREAAGTAAAAAKARSSVGHGSAHCEAASGHGGAAYGGGSAPACAASRAPCVAAAEEVWDALLAYDAHCFGAPRPDFVRAWIAAPGTCTLVALRPPGRGVHGGGSSTAAGGRGEGAAGAAPVAGRHDLSSLRAAPVASAAEAESAVVVGWGAVRPAEHGWRLGPVFADDASDGESMLRALRACVPPGQPFAVDVPTANAAAAAAVEAVGGMARVFEGARMYLGSNPRLPVHKVFGVTGFELG
eukprot:366467-Chlamydomonas_euryale.AAC.11